MILNGKVINPGEMRTRIEFVKRALTSAGGFQRPVAGEVVAEAWARRTNAHGSEVWAAEAAGVTQPVTWLARYRADVDETCLVRVKGQDDLHEIVSIDNVHGRGEYMEIKTRRVVGG